MTVILCRHLGNTGIGDGLEGIIENEIAIYGLAIMCQLFC